MPQVQESKRLQAKRAAAAKRQEKPKEQTAIQRLQAKIAEMRQNPEADPAIIAVLQARLEDMISPASGLAKKEAAGKKRLAKKTGN